MTVAELIEILQKIDDPEEKKIMVRDTAAGFRDVVYIEESLGYRCIINTERPKNRKY